MDGKAWKGKGVNFSIFTIFSLLEAPFNSMQKNL